MPIQAIAKLMRDNGIGAIPVVVQGKPVGIVTDRDIVIRLLPTLSAVGSVPASQVMSHNPLTCFEDQDITEVAALMGDNQVRQLLALDRCGRLIGVLSVDDIAENVSELLAGETLGEIVEKR